MSGEALTRKERSEALLASHGIPINPFLPVIEASEISLRHGEMVMRRSMCLFAVSYAAIYDRITEAVALLERWKLTGDLSPAEQTFLRSAPAPERERIQLSWRCEALLPLMWSTGLLEEMPFPNDPFDFECLSEFWKTVPHAYWEGVSTRSADEILDQADLIYRLHWAVRDAELKGRPTPGGLHGGVVMERHHALNWLIGYGGADWDEVATDT